MSNLDWTHKHGWFEVDHLPGHVPGYWDGNPAHNPKIEKEDAVRWLNESADCGAHVDGEGNLIVNFMDDSNPVDFPPQNIPTEHGRKVLYSLDQWIWGIAEPLKKAEFKIFMDTNKAVGYTSFNTIGGWHAPKFTRQDLEDYMTKAGSNLKWGWWIEDETTFLITHRDEDITWRLHPIRFNTVEGVLDLYDTQGMEWEWMLINQIIVNPDAKPQLQAKKFEIEIPGNAYGIEAGTYYIEEIADLICLWISDSRVIEFLAHVLEVGNIVQVAR